MIVIELNNVTKRYNDGKANEVVALNGVSLAIETGTSTAIVGVSGSGKTTLLNMIGCVDVPTEGTVTVMGERVDNETDAVRAKVRSEEIGFSLQQLGLLPNDSVYDNIRLPLYYSGKFPQKTWKERINKVTGDLQISSLLKTKVRELSGGQKQRVAIARALINDPAIILADEPTSALDSKTAAEVMELLKSLRNNGKTIIVVTHDTKLVQDYDKIVTIEDGKIIE